MIILEKASQGRRITCWLTFFFCGLMVYFIVDEFKRISDTPISSWTQAVEADCGVVLTGGQGRIQEGMSLLQQKRIKKLVISGVNPTSSLKEIFPPLPFYGEVQESDVILEKRSKTTYGNAQQSAPLIEALDCKSVVIITSKYHMRRAKKVFASVLPNEMITVDRSVQSYPTDESPWDLSLEVVKSLFYRIWAY